MYVSCRPLLAVFPFQPSDMTLLPLFTPFLCSKDCVIGFEYSGIHADGTRLMGMVVNSALASVIAYDECLSWRVPDDWSLEDAATVPCTYGTVSGSLLKVYLASTQWRVHKFCEEYTRDISNPPGKLGSSKRVP